MKKNYALITVLLGVLIVVLSACSSKYPGFDKTDTGLYYKFHVQNENAEKPQMGDILNVHMMYRTETDSVLFDTHKDKGPAKLQLVKAQYKGDIVEGLEMMRVGDSATFIVSADSFFFKNVGVETLPPFIKKGSILKFDIKLISFQKKADFEKEQQALMEKKKAMVEEMKTKEPENIKKYLADNKIFARPTTSGLYYVESKRGTGAKPEKGKTVKVQYTGTLFDGKVFDTSLEDVAKTAGIYSQKRQYEPFTFVLGQGQVIPGWDEGIGLMRVGGKAKLVIPSSLAYGAQGSGPIPPYTPLAFEVELIGIQ
jgi:FKBP-type peptidyl-prolyl cis-trans isomerase FkpA